MWLELWSKAEQSAMMMLRSSLSLLKRVSGARVCCCRQLHTSGTARMASAKLAVRDKTSKNIEICDHDRRSE